MTRPSRRRRVCWVSSRKRPASGEEIRATFRRIAESSPRVAYREHGASFEGRALFHAIVSSETVITRLEQAEGAKEDGSEGERRRSPGRGPHARRSRDRRRGPRR